MTPIIFDPLTPITDPIVLGLGLQVSQKKNDFGLEYERFNRLKWKKLEGATSYLIYRNDLLIVTLSPSTLRYEDHNRRKGELVAYAVIPIDAQGQQTICGAIIQ